MKMFNRNTVYLIFFVTLFEKLTAQDCSKNGVLVGKNLALTNPQRIAGTDRTYILSSYGGINCYGMLTEWKFSKEMPCDDVIFQVWRPQVGDDYLLVGHNQYNSLNENCPRLPNINEVTFYIPAHEQIPVEPGDVIGWTGSGMLLYDVGILLRNNIKVYDNCLNVLPGLICDGTNIVPVTQSWEFAIQAHIVQGLKPVIANLQYTVEVYENYTNIGASNFLYEIIASHEKNNEEMDNTVGSPVPLELSLDQSQTSFCITNVKSNNIYKGIVYIDPQATLDYEVQQHYEVNVTVKGLGLQSLGTLRVDVLDVNEAHTIDNPNEVVYIDAKAAKKGDQIFQLLVTDPDTINPTVIEYFITGSNRLHDTYPDPPFKINQYSGIVTVKQDLDIWIGHDQYVLDLEATDFMHVAITTLTVNIHGIRTAPVISNLDAQISIPEDAPDGSDIFQIVVKGEPNSVFQYNIIVVNPVFMMPKFGIHQTGWIYITTDMPELDFTICPNLTIQVEVSDGFLTSNPGILTVLITFVNHAPVFDPHEYFVSIPEMCGNDQNPQNCAPSASHKWPVPSLVINVNHRDVGQSMGCRVKPGFGSDFFDVVVQGCTTLNMVRRIDINTQPQYRSINLTLTVEDALGLSDTAKVYITVYDINDNDPYFIGMPYRAFIDENTPGGVSVLTVTANDIDFDENAEITYSIRDTTNGPKGTVYFQINPKTGVLYTKQPVDYEGIPEPKKVLFHAFATDNGETLQRVALEAIDITVVDVNDNRPIYACDFPLNENRIIDPWDPDYICFYNLDIRYDTLINYQILHFNASDVDTVTPVPYFYMLNTEPHFDIANNNSQGTLYITTTLYNYHMYAMIVMTTDEGTKTHPELKARPPSVVRIDTFDATEHLVDITLGCEPVCYNYTDISIDFILIMRNFCSPWFVRLQNIELHSDRTIVVVYALKDESTFLHSNFDKKKEFIHVNDLLHKLRKSWKGHPRQEFKDRAKPFDVVEVMPSYPKFLIHTLGGIITLFLLALLFVIIVIAIIIGMCKFFKVACFAAKKPTKHAWMKDKFDPDRVYEEIDSPGIRPTSTDSSNIYMTGPSNRRSTAQTRRPSIDTIHSIIYDTQNQAQP